MLACNFACVVTGPEPSHQGTLPCERLSCMPVKENGRSLLVAFLYTAKKMIAFPERCRRSLVGRRQLEEAEDLRWLGEQRCCSHFVPVASPGQVPVPGHHQGPVAVQQGQDALVISLHTGGDKARVFPFLSACVHNKLCNCAACWGLHYSHLLAR